MFLSWKPKWKAPWNPSDQDEKQYQAISSLICKQTNAEALTFINEPLSTGISVVLGKDKIFIQSEAVIDNTIQKEQIEKDLEYQKGFLVSVEKKLGNEKFVQNAKPEIIANEQKKKADAEAKIKALQESLASLK